MFRFWLICGCLFFLQGIVSAQPATAPSGTGGADVAVDPNALPTMEDLQQMLEDKKYQQVIQQTSRLMALKGAAAQPYNRFDLLKLKAEAQLQHGETEAALSTFMELGRETNDPHDKDVAQATILLMHRSPRGKYLPRSLAAGEDKAQPIDVIDPLTRKAGFEALYNDERQTLEPRLKVAMSAQSVPPIFPVIESVVKLRSLDVAASGSDQRTTELTKKLAEHAKGLMTSALTRMQGREEEIARQASTETVTTQIVVVNSIPTQVQSRTKQGLSDQNIRELREMIATCDKVAPVAQSLSKIPNVELDMQDVMTSTNEVQSKAKELLDTRY
jgi:hypothetical protein